MLTRRELKAIDLVKYNLWTDFEKARPDYKANNGLSDKTHLRVSKRRPWYMVLVSRRAAASGNHPGGNFSIDNTALNFILSVESAKRVRALVALVDQFGVGEVFDAEWATVVYDSLIGVEPMFWPENNKPYHWVDEGFNPIGERTEDTGGSFSIPPWERDDETR